MRYSTVFCVKCDSKLLRYCTHLCAKYVSRMMRYSTQFCVMSCCNAVQVCFVVKNITVVSCQECVAVAARCNISHFPVTHQCIITYHDRCAVRTSRTETVTKYLVKNNLLTGRNVLVKYHDLSHRLQV